MINRDSLFRKQVMLSPNYIHLICSTCHPQVQFSDEPPDADLYRDRDVWTVIDKAEVRLTTELLKVRNITNSVHVKLSEQVLICCSKQWSFVVLFLVAFLHSCCVKVPGNKEKK